MSVKIHSSIIRIEEDVVTVRRQAREIASFLGFDGNDQTRVATAVSEIARNAFHYAGGGVAEFLYDAESRLYTVEVKDTGPGIGELKKILGGTYQSRTGMGLGILGARRLMDQFEIRSETKQGTLVSLSKRLPDTAAHVTPHRLTKLSAELSKNQMRTVLDDLRDENHDLLRVMDELGVRQEDLSRLSAELEDTNRGVVALYAELDEKAERLKRADQMKSRFLSHMSHEFRTPLTSIMALSRLLMDEADGELSSEQHKQVNFIRKSAESLLEMVNDLLDLARVEAGKSVVRPTRFQVSNLFSGLRGVLRPLQVNEAVDLNFEDPAVIPPMFTDESKVTQILRNFISNSLKFTDRGEVRVSATFDSERDVVTFAVADTGIGIEPQNLGLIFQEFGQVDMPLQKRYRGTGLGLPLSKGLAELLGGAVRVDSTPGQGSIFYAEIPVTYRGDDAERPQPKSNCDLVLIDDEEVSRYLVRQTVGSSLAVAEASDGPTGIEMVRSHMPRGILLDLRMPGMSGFDVLKALKADASTRDIPVVILTSKVLSTEEREVLSSQAAAIFSKEVLSQPDGGERIRTVIEKGALPRPDSGMGRNLRH